ncbi:MAG: ROK family protein [Actinomycetota bacterium]|nr:ROK family protein [Actinomycetota bacterium]
MNGPVLGVDLGGTNMRAAIVAPDGTVLERRKQPTPQHESCPDALVELAGDVLAGDAVHAAVIGVPGRVDYHHGRLEWAPNLPDGWDAALVEQALSERLGVAVSLANDADLAAVGETWFGAARGRDDVVYVTVSTGVGAGVVLGRTLVAGRRSMGEAGWTVIDRVAAAKGQPATFEALGSGTALKRHAAAAGLDVDGAELVERVRAGDAAATAVWDAFVEIVAVGIANLAYLFTPQAIVVGGGVGSNGALLLDPVGAYLRDHGPPDLDPPIELLTAALGDDAGLVGAAAWHEATAAGFARG